jgi:hypothetical protein
LDPSRLVRLVNQFAGQSEDATSEDPSRLVRLVNQFARQSAGAHDIASLCWSRPGSSGR